MSTKEYVATARAMMAGDKGLIAMDESNPTCHKRFAKLGIPETVDMRRAYRDLIVTAPDLDKYISGAILFDETLRQKTKDGVPFVEILKKKGIIPGIKVDEGTKDLPNFPGEKITAGLDNLRERLKEYYQLGARFAKWRAVITIGPGIPSKACIKANTQELALYAALCQEANITPIVEPEVLMDGSHTLQQCYETTERTLHTLFNQLFTFKVDLQGVILKPNMVVPGKECPKQDSVEDVADATVNCLLKNVPASVAGVAFLSGGQSPEQASARLNAMNVRFKGKVPWPLTFSFSRAIQEPALDAWKGQDTNVAIAQKLLIHRAKCNAEARRGSYNTASEKI